MTWVAVKLWLSIFLPRARAFVFKNWKAFAVLGAFIVLGVVGCRVNNAAYDRGYAARGLVCETARLAAEDAVRAKQADLDEKGRLARIADEARQKGRENEIRAGTAGVIADLERAVRNLRARPPVRPNDPTPVTPIVVEACPLNEVAVREIADTLNANRKRLNGVLQ